jgi:DNA-binding LacI/PurR family transcriptional regulator
MEPIRLLSIGEQTVEHLRKGIQEGRWSGRLPGVVRLAKECDVSTGVVRSALRRLEVEGVISSRGLGRSRSVMSPEEGGTPLRTLRVAILIYDSIAETGTILWEIQRNLELAGYVVTIAEKSQSQLNFNLKNITRMVETTPADAWIVSAGSHELLTWFAGQKIPSLALYGRSNGLALARTGPDKLPAYLDATRQVIALGHRRIVMITRAGRRKPVPGTLERLTLEEMRANGIETGPYNLPDWEETPAGLNDLLEKLFRTTPPTALIIDEFPKLIATMQFLANHQINIPSQVSLIFADFDKALDWCYPDIAQMKWDTSLVIRRVIRWVAAVRKGNPDRKTINVPANFVSGGSIGPVPQGRR